MIRQVVINLEEALLEAAKADNLGRVAQLVEDGANIHYRRDVVIKAAINQGSEQIAMYLVQSVARAGSTATFSGDVLYLAVRHRHPDLVTSLLDGGMSVHQDHLATSLIDAISWAYDRKIVRRLLKEGINIHTSNDALLELAVSMNDLEVLVHLVEHGVEVDGRKDLLQRAVASGYHDIANYLLKKGVDPTSGGYIAAVIATENHDSKMVDIFSQHGISVSRDGSGKIVVHDNRGCCSII